MAYSKEDIEKIFDRIIIMISIDGYSIRKCLQQDKTPNSETFYKWIDEDEIKTKRYARACEERANILVEEMLEISDDQKNDIYIDKDGFEQTDHNVIQRSKLRVDTRKWIASKLKPKKYGDSQLLKFADNEGDKLKVNAIFNIDLLDVQTDDGTKEDS